MWYTCAMEKPQINNLIIAISGVGGAGKNSIMEVFEKYPDRYEFFVSYTDRPKREEEVEDTSYHFITSEEFDRAIQNDEFMEWETVRGQYRYGRKKNDLQKIWSRGKIPVMQIDVLGLQKFKANYNVLSFFIVPPSKEEAEKRIKARGTDSEEAIKHRVDRYELEMSYQDNYDYIIVNDDLEKAQKELINIVESKLGN